MLKRIGGEKMNNEEKILAMLEKMDARQNCTEAILEQLQQGQEATNVRLDKIDARLDSMQADITDLKQNVDTISERTGNIENDVKTISERTDNIENDVKTISERTIKIELVHGKKLDGLYESVVGNGEKFARLDIVENKVEDYGHRIWALEQVVKK